MFQRRTIRLHPPTTRRYMRLLNELESILRRAKNLVDAISEIERDSQALYKVHEAKERGEVSGEDLDEQGKQLVAKTSQDLPF